MSHFRRSESDEDQGSVSDEKEFLIEPEPAPVQPTQPRQTSLAFHLFATFCLVCSIAFYVFEHLQAPSNAACEELNWAWSPMMEGLEYEWRKYDPDVLPEIYIGPPTDERREAWRLLHDQGWIAFPASQLPRLNKSEDERNWWRLPPPRQDQVVALPEVVHQAHCVGFIYSFAHRAEWDFQTVPEIANELVYKLHANHCFVGIMRMIVCAADVTPVLFQRETIEGLGEWRTRDAPHLCKNWEALGEWQAARKVCRTNCQPWDLTGNGTNSI